MRHVRMLVTSMAVILGVCAACAGVAFANEGPRDSQHEWERLFGDCPLQGTIQFEGREEGLSACNYGDAGPESFFQAGKVTVHFVKPVILRSGEAEPVGDENFVIGARDGNTISKEAEPSPLSLTELINPELLPEPEKQRYEEYIAAGKSTKVTETTELAEPGTDIGLNELSLLAEEEYNGKSAFTFPVEIRIGNPFLGKSCLDGNNQQPIVVPFVTSETHPPAPNTPIHGQTGELVSNNEGNIIRIGTKTRETILVNNSFAAPGVNGCGTDGRADGALDAGLGLPSPAGTNTTELIGSLYQAGAEAVREHIMP